MVSCVTVALEVLVFMTLAALAILAGAGGVAWNSRRQELRARDLGRMLRDDQGPFYGGRTDQGENYWAYVQDEADTEASSVAVIEPPLFRDVHDPNFDAWYEQSALFGRVPASVFRRRLERPWQECYRGLIFFAPDNGVWGVEIGPDPADLAHYVARHPPHLLSAAPPESPGLPLDPAAAEALVRTIPALTEADIEDEHKGLPF